MNKDPSNPDNKAVIEKFLAPTYPEGWSPTVFNPKTGLGLLYSSPLDSNRIRDPITYNNIEMEFVDYWPTKVDGTQFNCIRASYSKPIGYGTHELYLVYIHIGRFPVDTIKSIGVWDLLNDEEKKNMEEKTFNLAKDEALAQPVGKKRGDDNFPRELHCSSEGCDGKLPYISPTILVKNAEAKGISPEEYIKTWKCAMCEPRKRGRAASTNLEFSSLPHTMKCKCGKEVIVNPIYLKSKAEKNNTTVLQLIESFVCQSCCPTKGRHKGEGSGNKTEKSGVESTTTTTTRGRKPNPEFAGLPKTIKCKCGKEVTANYAYLKIKAEKEETTIQNLVENFQCQTCHPTKGRKKVEKE